MNILVTGGFGFIGTNFILKFINNKNINILNYDSLTYAGNKNNLTSINDCSNYNYIIADICDRELVNRTIIKFKPNIIVHFAAESHVDRSIEDPFQFINTNIMGTSVLLNESLAYYNVLNEEAKKKFKFIHISTDEVYGSTREGSFTEDSNFFPNSPYSASKASAEHLVSAWNRTFKLPTNIVNCTNNYGPFQYPEKLIPLTIINCILNKPIPIYGKGDNIRDWIYVEDHCEAIYSIIMNSVVGEKYNVGGESEFKNIDIVIDICSLVDKYHPSDSVKNCSDLITFVDDRLGHDFRYSLNIEKIKNTLNWLPKKNIHDGLEYTVKWYIDNKEWWMDLIKSKEGVL